DLGRHRPVRGRPRRCRDAPGPGRSSREPGYEGRRGGSRRPARWSRWWSRPGGPARLMFEGPVQRLIDELARLPGVGRKTAQRLAFHLLAVEEADARRLANSIVELREQIRPCRRCFNMTGAEECSICQDQRRDPHVVCVVERPNDIPVVERTQEFRGRYHVLGGAISPINGV